ncbi:MAG: 50S ribosomal protein L15 [Candidatus Glassbacteria bacterium]
MSEEFGLHKIGSPPGARKKKTRVGRGPGSGMGKTCGRGTKGQKSRSGSGMRRWFEGGQMPIQRRLPKRGFHNRGRIKYQIVNIGELTRYPHLEEFTPEVFLKLGLIHKKNAPVCILGSGELDKKVVVLAQRFSKSARDKIEALGGRAEVI